MEKVNGWPEGALVPKGLQELSLICRAGRGGGAAWRRGWMAQRGRLLEQAFLWFQQVPLLLPPCHLFPHCWNVLPNPSTLYCPIHSPPNLSESSRFRMPNSSRMLFCTGVPA